MDENRLRFGVGVLVISSIGIGIILTFLFGAFPSVLSNDYKLEVRFPSAEGIGNNSHVTVHGYRIGTVSDVQLHGQGGVLVTLSMQQEHRDKLTHRFIPRIGSGNLVSGDAKIEFFKGTPQQLEDIFGDNTNILDQPYSELEESIDYGMVTPRLTDMQDEFTATFSRIREAGESIARAGDTVHNLAKRVETNLEKVDVDSIANDLGTTTGTIREVADKVNALIDESQLDQTLANIKSLTEEANTTLQSFQRVGQRFENVGAEAEKTIQTLHETAANVEQITQPFADNSDEYAQRLLETLTNLNNAMVQAETFGRTLNNSDGTIKRLIQDQDMYYQIRRTIQNIEEATSKLRPIMDDMRVFSDKVARDPRQLGVRGAITTRPSGYGIK